MNLGLSDVMLGLRDCRLIWAIIYDGNWGVLFYLAFCDKLFGTCRILHLAGGLLVKLM